MGEITSRQPQAGSLWSQTITSISPTSGTRNTQVTITGSGFGATQGSNYVMFATTKASIKSWSSTQIVCVPQNMGAGTVSVYVSVGGVQINSVNFTLTNPVINNLSINSAPVDQEITINGNNYGTTQGTSTVTFNNVTANPSSWSNTAITVPVPTGATTGNIVSSSFFRFRLALVLGLGRPRPSAKFCLLPINT